MNERIATILQTYRRPQYFKEQLRAIRSQTVKSDSLWIVENEGGKDFDLYPDDAQLIYADPNLKFHLRFAVGLLIDAEYLAFFDDDTIPGKRWYESCLDVIEGQDCVCVTVGIRINPNMKGWSKVGWCNPNPQAVEVDFGGHAWFFRGKHLKHMWRDEIINYTNGEDIMLSANLKRFAGIPTIVPPHPESNPELWGSSPQTAMKYGSDDVAHWITVGAHFEDRFALIREYKARGWK